MTISVNDRVDSYSGDGTSTSFSYTFPIQSDSELKVTLRSSSGVDTVQTLTTDYTVSGAGNDAGGSIIMVTAPASGETLYIEGVTPRDQNTAYSPGGPFSASAHESALDQAVKVNQEQDAEIARSVKVAVGDSISELPPAAQRLDKVLGFDSLTGDVSMMTRGTGGIITGAYTDLTDTEGSYVGKAGNVPTVNNTETGLELTDVAGSGDPYWIKFTGVGDGVTDDGPALQTQAEAARAAGKGLRGDASKTYYIASTTGLTFSTAGTYDWLNIPRKANPSLVTSGSMCTFDGPAFEASVPIKSNLAQGTYEIFVDTSLAASYTVGKAFALVSTQAFHTSASASTQKKSEWCTVTKVETVSPAASGTTIPAGETLITIDHALLYSYTSASPDSAFLMTFPETMHVKMRNCDASITGGTASGPTFIGDRFNRCASVDVDDQKWQGFTWAQAACFECIDAWFGKVECHDAVATGLGYGISPVSCYRFHCEFMNASNLRHFTPFTTGGGNNLMTMYGSFGTYKGTGFFGAPMDVHPGVHFVSGGNVIASTTDANESMATLQSGRIDIQSIVINGGLGAGVLIQNFGGPLNEYKPHVRIGTIDGGVNTDSTEQLLFVESRDPTNLSKLSVDVGVLRGISSGTAINIADTAASAGTHGGDIDVRVGVLEGKFDVGRIIYCNNDNPLYQHRVKVDYIDVIGTDGTSYAAYADQTTTTEALGGTLTLGGTSGSNVSASNSTDVFMPSMVGSEITKVTGTGVGKITRFIDSKNVWIDISTTFDATSFSAKIDRKGEGSVIELGSGRVNIPNSTVSIMRTVGGTILYDQNLKYNGLIAFKNESGDGGVFPKDAPVGGFVSVSAGSATVSRGSKFSVTWVSTGTYDITFDDPLPSTWYAVVGYQTGKAGGSNHASSISTTGFRYTTYDAGGTLGDTSFHFAVIQYR